MLTSKEPALSYRGCGGGVHCQAATTWIAAARCMLDTCDNGSAGSESPGKPCSTEESLRAWCSVQHERLSAAGASWWRWLSLHRSIAPPRQTGRPARPPAGARALQPTEECKYQIEKPRKP